MLALSGDRRPARPESVISGESYYQGGIKFGTLCLLDGHLSIHNYRDPGETVPPKKELQDNVVHGRNAICFPYLCE